MRDSGHAPCCTLRDDESIIVQGVVWCGLQSTGAPSEEVHPGRGLARGSLGLLIGHGLKDLKAVAIDDALISDLHDRGHVAAAVAVVGRAPDGHEAVLRAEHELVALLDELMRAGDERDAVDVVELARDRRAEQPSRPARRDRPRLARVVRIGPEDVWAASAHDKYISQRSAAAIALRKVRV